MGLDATAMPQIPPALAALFAQRALNATTAPGAPATPAITPPAMTPGAAAPMRTVFGMPQGTGMFQPQAKPAPAPTDDPAISGKPALPALPDTSALTAEQQKVSDIESKMSGIKSPTPEDYKPGFWRKLGSMAVAFGVGFNNKNPEAAASAADSVLHAPYYEAQRQYQAQVSPLQKQLEYERSVGVPMAESEARLAQENFNNRLNLTKEQREQTAFENETGDKIFEEQEADGKTHYYQTTKGGVKREVPEPREQAEDRRRREEDANSPAPNARPEPDPDNKGQWRVKTKAGGYIPYTPKSVDEGAMLGDKRATGLFMYEHAKEGKGKDNPDENGYTTAEQREITQKTRPSQVRISALEKTRSLLVGSPDKEDQAQLAALDKEIADEHAKMDAVENEVVGRRQQKGAGKGVSATTGGGFKVPAGAPPAKGVPDGHQLKQNGKVIAVAKGGQWVAPNSGGTQ